MNVPNTLTVLRIFATGVVIALVCEGSPRGVTWALLIFMLAAFSDWLDGFLARRSKQISSLGTLLDPIADKILVLGLLTTFAALRLVPVWMVWLIAGRELFGTAARLYALRRHLVIAAAAEGKHKALSQMWAIFMVLIWLAGQHWVSDGAAEAFHARMHGVITISLWIAVILTLTSGLQFAWRNRHLLLRHPLAPMPAHNNE